MSSILKIKKEISKLPDSPGVYLFKRGKNILYIGKATSLKDRVRSYFSKDIAETRGPLIVKMLSEFQTIDHIKTDSVLEALILEAHLIKKYQPEANVAQKDNKSFNFVVITKEDFPRVLTVRSRELLINNPYDIAHSFGPFPNGGQLKEALKLVRKLFPYRDKCTPASELKPNQKPKPCFNRQIGLCPGVCSGDGDPDGDRHCHGAAVPRVTLSRQPLGKHPGGWVSYPVRRLVAHRRHAERLLSDVRGG